MAEIHPRGFDNLYVRSLQFKIKFFLKHVQPLPRNVPHTKYCHHVVFLNIWMQEV